MALPSLSSTALFRAKVLALQSRRLAQDTFRPPGQITKSDTPLPNLLLELKCPLWRETDPREKPNERGKVQNLRLVAAQLDRLLIPAGQTFSFWKQVGRTTRRKGYAVGRQIQEGCLVPARGGGICQLTNMLYEAALSSGCQIVERHPHTRRVPGASENKPDATVAWNHIDLRFRPSDDIHLRVFLTPDDLIVQLWGKTTPKRRPLPVIQPKPSRTANSCSSCGMESCFRHEEAPDEGERSAMLVDRVWPEYVDLVLGHDLLLMPLDPRRFARPAYAWPVGGTDEVWAATVQTLIRSWRSRKLANEGAARRQAALEADEALARTYAKRLGPEVTRLAVYQQLLPFLQRDGHLGGRRYDVLMTRLPLAELQARLDETFGNQPDQKSLSDFRAPSWMVQAENEALANAERILSPHTEIARLFGERAVLVPWNVPSSRPLTKGNALAFPGPAIARKGSAIVRETARSLGMPVVLAGSNLEPDGFWEGIKMRRPDGYWLDGVACVVHPAVIEEQPRKLLEALACGVPVVATRACGLPLQHGLTLAEPSDFPEAVREVLAAPRAIARIG